MRGEIAKIKSRIASSGIQSLDVVQLEKNPGRLAADPHLHDGRQVAGVRRSRVLKSRLNGSPSPGEMENLRGVLLLSCLVLRTLAQIPGDTASHMTANGCHATLRGVAHLRPRRITYNADEMRPNRLGDRWVESGRPGPPCTLLLPWSDGVFAVGVRPHWSLLAPA